MKEPNVLPREVVVFEHSVDIKEMLFKRYSFLHINIHSYSIFGSFAVVSNENADVCKRICIQEWNLQIS